MESVFESSHLKVAGRWKDLWKLQVPNKVKVFLWRAVRGCLPTRLRLQTKGVVCTGICPLCLNNLENEWHCLVACPSNLVCWKLAGFWNVIRVQVDSADSFDDLIFRLLASISKAKISQVVMLMCVLWWRSNGKVWEDADRSPSVTVRRATNCLTDWGKCHRRRVSVPQRQISPPQWVKPPLVFAKCNLDAAVFGNQRRFGLGMCLRDSLGRFIIAKSVLVEGMLQPVEAEALGYQYVFFNQIVKLWLIV